MAEVQQEDIEYAHVDEFALEDQNATTNDEDQTVETVLMKEIRKYLADQIATHNSFDAIVPEAEGTMTTQQQVQMHKCVVIHLRQIDQMIKEKIKEAA